MLIKRKEMDMANTRKKYTAEEKVRILRLHLVERRAVSDICDELSLNPNVFYRWQKQFFENGAAAFDQPATRGKEKRFKRLEHRNTQLQEKLAQKDEVIAEIMASHIELKRNLGEI